MTDGEMEWFVAHHIMDVEERPTSGIGSKHYGDWGYTTSRDVCSQAEARINENWELSQAYSYALLRVLKTHIGIKDTKRPVNPPSLSWSSLQLIRSASARERCDAMYAIRGDIKQAKANQ